MNMNWKTGFLCICLKCIKESVLHKSTMYCNLFFFSSSSSFPTQSLCGAEWLHRCFEGTVHWQCNGPALPIPASPVWIHCPAPESVPPESYPHQPAGGSRGTGPTGHTHAHWGWVNTHSKATRVVKSFYNFYNHKCTNPHAMILSLAQVSGYSGGACSHYCVDWQMNFSSDRSPGLKSFLSSASCPSRTTHGSWAPPGRSSFCWPAWRSTAPRCWATSPTSPTNTPRQTMSCRGEECTAYVTHLLFTHWFWFSNM